MLSLQERKPELPVDQREGTKTCVKCGIDKDINLFPCSVAKGKIYHKKKCSKCVSEEQAERYNRSPYQSPNKRDNQYTYKYGRPLYDELFEEQHGKCLLCGNFSERTLCVDHDRRCCPSDRTCGNCVRGLLCLVCNVQLGVVERWIEDKMVIPTETLENYRNRRR